MLLRLIGLATLLLIGCTTLQTPTATKLSVIEITFDGSSLTSSQIRTQGLRPETGLSITAIASEPFDHLATNTRYIYAQFKVKSSLESFDNLTLYAYNQSANNIGGTAIKNLTNFGNDSLTDTEIVKNILPSHRHVLDTNAGTVAIDPDHADFQGFTPFEAQNLENAAKSAGVLQSNDDVLEYGFVARNSAGGRSLAIDQEGTITLALRFVKDNNPQRIPYKFTMTFVLANESTSRVTRDVQNDSSSAAQSRNPSANPFFIGNDEPSVVNRVFVPNVRISTTPDFLLEQTQTSSAEGLVSLPWDTSNRTALVDSSGHWTFTPLTYSDIDHVSAGFRYLTATYRVDYSGSTAQNNVVLRALNRPSNLAGSAVFNVQSFTAENLNQEIIGKTIQPLHGMQLGATVPVPDISATSFQAYRQSESRILTENAKTLGTIGSNDQILDYGYALQTCTSICGFFGAFTTGSQGRVYVSVRIPRNFTVPVEPATNPPTTKVIKPFKFNFSFLISSQNPTRVSRALLETTTAAETRANALGSVSNPSQLVLLGNDQDSSNSPNVYPIRIPSIQIATNTTLP